MDRFGMGGPGALTLAAACFALLGCAAQVKEARSLNVQPSAPAFSGTYDFDLLGDVEGQYCASQGDRTTYTVSGLGSDIAPESALSASHNGAMFDALEKLKGADVLLVTRTRSEGDASKACTTVWGKAVRIKKGPTLGSAPSQGPAQAWPAPAPAPSQAWPAPAAPPQAWPAPTPPAR